MSAQERYDQLQSDRSQFLDMAVVASRLTLPYLIKGENENSNAVRLYTPWQSVGARGVVTLASKLMLALLPASGSFFKLQVNDGEVDQFDPKIKSEIDLSFSKIERIIMEDIAASDDRVTVHQALKHLVVGGNALIYMDKKKLKLFPLNRYVVDRDGSGNVLEIVTKERISKKLVKKIFPSYKELKPNSVSNDEETGNDNCDVFTHVTRENNRFVWYQEIDGKKVPKSEGKAPLDTTPWLVLRWNTVDGEMYGRGRCEEFIGDLKSLEALSQALVEGSAVAAKVIFTVSPSSTTKPQTLAQAANGAIVTGRPDDIQAITVGKTADFRTAYEMAMNLEKRLADAFLILQVRNSERTTAEEVRSNQLELEQSLGGLFSLLTVEFLVPYLNRKLSAAQKSGQIPRLPNKFVEPTITAGLNALGRGADREGLVAFLQTLSQTMGPEVMMNYIIPEEVVKRFAASVGIDVLGLVKNQEQVQMSDKQKFDKAKEMELTKQTAAMMNSAQFDPTKNPQAPEVNGQNLPNQGQAGPPQAPPQGSQPPTPQ